jgi:excisionase family DNA binding protein
MPRRANPRKIKSHLVYTVQEAAETLGMHKGTVLRWVTIDCLPATTDRKPWLIDGRDLKRFLETRNQAAKRPLGLGEFYCLGCRDRRRPDGGLVDYRPRIPAHGMLSGLCPACGQEMFRAMRWADLCRLPRNIQVAFPMAQTGISSSAPPILNVDLQKEPETHGKTQR